MFFAAELPSVPPAEVLAELDEAARVLDELRGRAAELTLGTDAESRALRIELDGRPLRPTQLLDLLAGA